MVVVNKTDVPKKKPGSEKKQNWENPQNPEDASDKRDLEQLERQKKEAELIKENLESEKEN